jgi:tRNA(fMet)-specific endonuclease VapC
MRYMLDTNTCIYLIKRKPSSVLATLQRKKIDDVCISSITLGELEYGVSKSKAPAKNKWALLEFLAPLRVLPFSDNAAAAYGRIRADMETAGTPIGPLDLLIAAHALSDDLTLVTNNIGEFRRVHSLRVENWVQ